MIEQSTDKRVAREYFPAFVAGDRAWWERHARPDFRRHDPGLPYEVVGIEGLQRHRDALLAGVTDLNLPIHDVMEGEGKVLVRLRCRGTHRGTLFGHAPAGGAIDVEVFDLFRLEGGRLVEHRAMVDSLSLLKQLGASSL